MPHQPRDERRVNQREESSQQLPSALPVVNANQQVGCDIGGWTLVDSAVLDVVELEFESGRRSSPNSTAHLAPVLKCSRGLEEGPD